MMAFAMVGEIPYGVLLSSSRGDRIYVESVANLREYHRKHLQSKMVEKWQHSAAKFVGQD